MDKTKYHWENGDRLPHQIDCTHLDKLAVPNAQQQDDFFYKDAAGRVHKDITREVHKDIANEDVANNEAVANNKAVVNDKGIAFPAVPPLPKLIPVLKIEFEAGKFEALLSTMAEKLEPFCKK